MDRVYTVFAVAALVLAAFILVPALDDSHYLSRVSGKATVTTEGSFNIQDFPPVIVGATTFISDAGDLVDFNITAYDPNGDPVSLNFSPPLNDTGEWLSTVNDSGILYLNVTADDGTQQTLQVLTVKLRPYCSDGNITPPEECDDGNELDGDGCSKYCIIEPLVPAGGGGGGGGACTPEWECTDWGPCFDGQQTRSCTDVRCGRTTGRPEENQECAPPELPIEILPPRPPTRPAPVEPELPSGYVEPELVTVMEELDSFDVDLGETAYITIKDAEGNPVPEATIIVLTPSDKRFYLRTDAAGQFRYLFDEKGEWWFSVDKEGYQRHKFSIDVNPAPIILPVIEVPMPVTKEAYAVYFLILFAAIFVLMLFNRFMSIETYEKTGKTKKDIFILLSNTSRHWKRTAKDLELEVRIPEPTMIKSFKVMNPKLKHHAKKEKGRITYTFTGKTQKSLAHHLHHGKTILISFTLSKKKGSYPDYQVSARYHWRFFHFFKTPASDTRMKKKHLKSYDDIKKYR